MNINLIKPYEKNAKKHPKKQIEQVAASIKEFGFNQPIVVDKDNVIIVGHGRLEASKLLGLKDVPTITVDLTKKQADSYRLADNKLNESDWDMDLVIEELKSLDSEELVELSGFDKDLLIEPDAKDDDVPDVPEEPKSKLGDIYQLGSHRIMCGDSTKLEDVDKLMDGKKADMVFTDPPYNVAFNGRSGKFDVIKNDDLSDNDFQIFIDKFLAVIEHINANTYYICCNWAFYGILQVVLKPKSCIVWAKNVFGLGRGYRHQHEFILFDGLIDPDIKNESDLWQIKKDVNYKHPTQKPVEIPARAIKNSSKNGNIVVDIFLGSGSTLIACEKTERICYGMELDPKYIDVIIQRWEDYTGQKAVKVE